MFVFFDEETERRATEVGLDVALPPAGLRHRLDSKIITTQLGEEAGVPSVPNVLRRATSYPELLELAATAGCGNDIFPGALSPGNRGERSTSPAGSTTGLRRRATAGQLEVDYLVDAGTEKLYLGELNPRLSGISSMTSVSASAYADVPLFLFHLAEYLGVDYELDVEDLRRRWGSDHLTDVWGQSS